MTGYLDGEGDVDEVGGGARVQDLLDTAQTQVCTLPPGNQGETQRFGSAVLEYLRNWMRRRTGDDPLRSGVVAFVLTSDLTTEGDRLSAGRTKQLFHTKLDAPLSGQLFLTTPSGKTVRPLQLQATDLSDVVDDIIGWPVVLVPPLGDRTTVLADLATGEAFVCYAGVQATGVEGELSAIPFNLLAPRVRVDTQSVLEFLRRAHTSCLETPQQGLEPVWADPERGVPVKEAEHAIQSIVRLMANYEFQTCKVLSEASAGDRRADVLIYPDDEANGERTLLELKVLRQKHWSKDPSKARNCAPYRNLSGVVKGIDQADEYREKFGMKNALLCVYDMRQTNDPALTDGVVDQARRLNVGMQRYFMYRSSEHRRQNQPDSAYQAMKKLGSPKPD